VAAYFHRDTIIVNL